MGRAASAYLSRALPDKAERIKAYLLLRKKTGPGGLLWAPFSMHGSLRCPAFTLAGYSPP
ncbi:hypothetical protein CBM2586_B10638 [Cupriavidus phytorum]|uniref:Uncharacterized protein n=1 Tax=Cupriavidus taiwanensis TaxID=164546 RepID=A0A975XCT4_9BURK|nr:hypothetical protein CBM2586_B10638 [Cupriavidus taiwanensis]